MNVINKLMVSSRGVKRRILTGVAALVFSTSAAGAVTLDTDHKMGLDGLYFWYADGRPSHTFSREITPKGDCFKVVNGYAFLVWYKGGMGNRDLMISRSKVGSNKWVTVQLPAKNTLFTGTKKSKQFVNAGNSHKTAAVGISEIDGTVHITFDSHSSKLRYIVSKKNIAFAPDSEFKASNFNRQRDYFRSGEPVARFTYPTFNMNNAGELTIDYRIGTSRQGNRVMTSYNGQGWSKPTNLIIGDNSRPSEFNHYGSLSYQQNRMYLKGTIRVKGSPINYNQGVYVAESGQLGTETWTNIKGDRLTPPVRNINQMNEFRVAQPIQENSDRMGSSPDFIVSENGAMHFTGMVTRKGNFHYFKKANSSNITKGRPGPRHIHFAADGRIYGVELSSGGALSVRSTGENESRWRRDFSYNKVNLAAMAVQYANGKIHIVAAEKKNSDKRPFRHIVLDVGLDQNVQDKAPTVSFATPSGNSTVEKDYELYVNVDAQDDDGSIDNVQLFINGNFVRQENKSPYEWGHFDSAKNPTELDNLPIGEHEIKVTATDNKGNSKSASMTLVVKGEETSGNSDNSSSSSSSSSGGSSSSSSSSGGSGVSTSSKKPVVYAINTGGDAFTGPRGITFQKDDFVSGGRTFERQTDIENVRNDELYSSHRWGDFTYDIPVSNGVYDVTLKLAEIYHTEAGKREFTLLVEDETAIVGLDLISAVGANTAYDRTVQNVSVRDGKLTIRGEASINAAMLSGIIIRSENGTATTPTAKPKPTPKAEPKPEPKPSSGACNLNRSAGGLPEFSLFTIKRKNTPRSNFCDVKKWYEESRGQQVLKLFKGDNFQNFNRSGRSHARTESQTPAFAAGSKWHELEATMRVQGNLKRTDRTRNYEVTVGQIFANCRGPVLRFAMTESGRIRIGSHGGSGSVVSENRSYLNEEFTIKMRSNGRRLEAFLNGKKVHSGDVRYKKCSNGRDTRYHFRWGVYSNQTPQGDFRNTVKNIKRR